MLFSKEYVGYLARQLADRLLAAEFIETSNKAEVVAKVNGKLFEELSVEDRLNEEVRQVLDAISDDMRTEGASYHEMFKKVKNQLVKKYKVVL